jgi:hypothetical protein
MFLIGCTAGKAVGRGGFTAMQLLVIVILVVLLADALRLGQRFIAKQFVGEVNNDDVASSINTMAEL